MLVRYENDGGHRDGAQSVNPRDDGGGPLQLVADHSEQRRAEHSEDAVDHQDQAGLSCGQTHVLGEQRAVRKSRSLTLIKSCFNINVLKVLQAFLNKSSCLYKSLVW